MGPVLIFPISTPSKGQFILFYFLVVPSTSSSFPPFGV